MRETILNEIRRLAAANEGRPPGKIRFERETGIIESRWRGVYWARWGDALIEAGFPPNPKTTRLDQDFALSKIVEACRHFRKVPTFSELQLYTRQVDPDFPRIVSYAARRFSKAEMLDGLRRWLADKEGFDDVLAMLPPDVDETSDTCARPSEGYVYLIRSGAHYKIGRSDEIERRVKEITIALPEAATMIHTIRTDDPAGIEAYWHRRFSTKRANGEWFKLAPADVSAFKRRKYQ